MKLKVCNHCNGRVLEEHHDKHESCCLCNPERIKNVR